MWVREPRVYIAAPDSLGLLPGTRLTLSYGGKKIAESEVTTVLDGGLIAASLTSGSLRGVKKLERLAVAADRSAIRARSILRVGYPARGRQSLLFTCGELKLAKQPLHGAYRADVLDDRSYRLVRDMAIAVTGPWPDTLLIRLFDEAADEEIALERGDLDVAVFWPGEASPHIREFGRWQGRALGNRSLGFIAAHGAGPDMNVFRDAERWRSLASWNQDLFRGDLVACSQLMGAAGSDTIGASSLPGMTPIEVDSSLPGHDLLQRTLNRGVRSLEITSVTRRVRLSYVRGDFARADAQDPTPGEWPQPTCLFAFGCPVIARPDLRPEVYGLWAGPLVDLFECEPAGGKP